jgi:hypothetical protein
MVHVRLVCSDPDCADVFEAFGPLEEVEALVCKCGCALQVIGWLGEHRGDDRFVALLPIAA